MAVIDFTQVLELWKHACMIRIRAYPITCGNHFTMRNSLAAQEYIFPLELGCIGPELLQNVIRKH